MCIPSIVHWFGWVGVGVGQGYGRSGTVGTRRQRRRQCRPDLSVPAIDRGAATISALRTLDRDLTPAGEVVGLVAGLEQLIGYAKAEQAALVAALAVPGRCGDVTALAARLADPDSGLATTPDGSVDPELVQAKLDEAGARMAAAEIGAALASSPTAAKARVSSAQDLVGQCPDTWQALQSGLIDAARATLICHRTAVLDQPQRRQVQQQVIPLAQDTTYGTLQPLPDRAVIIADPEAAERRRKDAYADRRVTRKSLPDGMGQITAVLPAPDAVTVSTALDLLAAANHGLDRRKMGQLRADCFTDVFTNLAGTVDIHTPTVDIHTPTGNPAPSSEPADPARSTPAPATDATAAGNTAHRHRRSPWSHRPRPAGDRNPGHRSEPSFRRQRHQPDHRRRSDGAAAGTDTTATDGEDAATATPAPLRPAGLQRVQPPPPTASTSPALTARLSRRPPRPAAQPPRHSHPTPTPPTLHSIAGLRTRPVAARRRGRPRHPGRPGPNPHLHLHLRRRIAKPDAAAGGGCATTRPTPGPPGPPDRHRPNGHPDRPCPAPRRPDRPRHHHRRHGHRDRRLRGQHHRPGRRRTLRRPAAAGAWTYRPRQELRDLTIALTATCCWPGCRQPAQRCDLDHRQPFDHHQPDTGGPTTDINIDPLCRAHHLLKTHTDWTYHRNPDRTYTFTSATGLHHHTPPERVTLPAEFLTLPFGYLPHPAPPPPDTGTLTDLIAACQADITTLDNTDRTEIAHHTADQRRQQQTIIAEAERLRREAQEPPPF